MRCTGNRYFHRVVLREFIISMLGKSNGCDIIARFYHFAAIRYREFHAVVPDNVCCLRGNGFLNIPVIDEREFQVLLESEITISSVSKYCIKKSKGRICRYYNADSTISQLKSFDINYIRDLNYVVQDNFINAVMKINQITIDKLISYILIIADAQKYFSLPTANTIKSISKDGYNLLNSFLAMDQICEEYHITVE